MIKGREIRCFDYVNHPYPQVRDALAANALEVFRSATQAAASRAHSVASQLRVDIGGIEVGADIEEQTVATIERGRAYLRAGADLVFVPLLIDPAIVRRVADGIAGPISLMILPDAPPAETLFAAGATRISIGPAAMLAALGVLAEIAEEMRQKGTWSSIERSFYGFGEAEALFASR